MTSGHARAMPRGTAPSSAALAASCRPSSVFTVAPPRPGKCFAVAATLPDAVPRGASFARRPRRRRREGRVRPSRRRARPVGHRREVDVHSGAAQLSRRGAATCRTWSGVPCSGCAGCGPAQPTARTSPPSWSTITSAPPCALRWTARVSAAPLRPACRRSAEQDHAGRLAGAQAAPDVGGRPAAREGRNDQLADLLAQRQARGRCACARGSFARRRPRLPRCASDDQPNAERSQRAPARATQPPPRGGVSRQPHARAASPAHRSLLLDAGPRQPSVNSASPKPPRPGRAHPVAPVAAAIGRPGQHAAGGTCSR